MVLEPYWARLSARLAPSLASTLAAHVLDQREMGGLDEATAERAINAMSQAHTLPEEVDPLQALSGLLESWEASNAWLGTSYLDLLLTASRLALRDAWLGWLETMVDLRSAMRELATTHLQTLVLPTSDGQAVQPTTLAHYLAGQIAPLERSSTRGRQLFERVNRSPFGAGSGMASAVPIRREVVARALGFDGVAENTFDAVAADDVELEAVAVLGLTATGLERLVNDLAWWSRDDIGIVTPNDDFIEPAHGQPQRRTPGVLSHLRWRLNHQLTNFTEFATLASGGTMLGDEAVHVEIRLRVLDEITDATGTIRLLEEVVRGLVVERALAANRVNRGWATSSELADLFMVDHKLPRDQAYRLAESIVREATIQGIDARTITNHFIDAIALRETGVELGIEPETIGRCLAPRPFIERRSGLGGPAPAAVRDSLDREALSERRERAWLAERRTSATAALAEIDARVVHESPGKSAKRPSSDDMI
jgi:argininosuccinate lyase